MFSFLRKNSSYGAGWRWKCLSWKWLVVGRCVEGRLFDKPCETKWGLNGVYLFRHRWVLWQVVLRLLLQVNSTRFYCYAFLTWFAYVTWNLSGATTSCCQSQVSSCSFCGLVHDCGLNLLSAVRNWADGISKRKRKCEVNWRTSHCLLNAWGSVGRHWSFFSEYDILWCIYIYIHMILMMCIYIYIYMYT